ncbi:MAG: nuclear transport factor 2 family protein [Opitutaceae bacterium]
MDTGSEHAADISTIRQLLDDYLRMYASRDDSLTTHFSEDFSGFTGGGDFLVKDKKEWVAITRQDFAQVKDPLRIELKDLSIQLLAETTAVATSFFIIHLPIKDHILSRETARLVLIFHKESEGWKISHSSISIPYYLVRKGEVYPMQELMDRNQHLEELIAERTIQLSKANESLRQANEELEKKIAQHRQAEEALQRSEGLYRSILTASPDDITITDREGHILMVSPAALTTFGTGKKEDFLGRSILDYIVPEDRDRAKAAIALKRQGIATGTNEYRGLRSDGSTFDIEVNSEFIRDAKGSPAGMVVIIRDISGRKKVEAEKEKLEVQNRQLQKAESLGRMAGAIAHHFNNKLQSVMLSLELTMKRMDKSEGAFQSMTTAIQSTREAAEVSRLMLIYLGQTVAKHEPLDLSKTCHQSLSLLRAVMPQNVVLETHLPSPGPVIDSNADQIQHVLTNLVTNAWEAGNDARGCIRLAVKTLSASEIPTTHRFPIDCQLDDPVYACLEVADGGCGIPEQDIESIFDPFFSSKFPGRGMGLAVVLGLVRAHNGAITVESVQGWGSIFRVFFSLSAKTVPKTPAQTVQDSQ